jgi:hypothetical protein
MVLVVFVIISGMTENPDSGIKGDFEKLNDKQREVAEMLIGRGWTVEVKVGEQPNQVDTVQGGLVECGDGRLQGSVVGSEAKDGPKLFGGVYAVTAERKDGSAAAFEKACADIVATGFVPTLHKDASGHLCGKEGLWRGGKLIGLPNLEFDPNTARRLVIANRGATVDLLGDHKEKKFSINYIEGTTREPDENNFHNDAWYIPKLGLNNPLSVLQRAAETVEELTEVRIAEIWVE